MVSESILFLKSQNPFGLLTALLQVCSKWESVLTAILHMLDLINKFLLVCLTIPCIIPFQTFSAAISPCMASVIDTMLRHQTSRTLMLSEFSLITTTMPAFSSITPTTQLVWNRLLSSPWLLVAYLSTTTALNNTTLAETIQRIVSPCGKVSTQAQTFTNWLQRLTSNAKQVKSGTILTLKDMSTTHSLPFQKVNSSLPLPTAEAPNRDKSLTVRLQTAQSSATFSTQPQTARLQTTVWTFTCLTGNQRFTCRSQNWLQDFKPMKRSPISWLKSLLLKLLLKKKFRNYKTKRECLNLSLMIKLPNFWSRRKFLELSLKNKLLNFKTRRIFLKLLFKNNIIKFHLYFSDPGILINHEESK